VEFNTGTTLLQLCSDAMQKCHWVALMKSHNRLETQHEPPTLSELFPTRSGSVYKEIEKAEEMISWTPNS